MHVTINPFFFLNSKGIHTLKFCKGPKQVLKVWNCPGSKHDKTTVLYINIYIYIYIYKIKNKNLSLGFFEKR
jgi:hypothetical protein